MPAGRRLAAPRRVAGAQVSIAPEALERLESVGGSPFVLEMIAAFLQQAPERMRELQAAAEAGSAAEAGFAAHRLVSTAGNLGATELSAAARAIERALAEGDGWASVRRRIGEAEALLTRDAEALRAERARRERGAAER